MSSAYPRMSVAESIVRDLAECREPMDIDAYGDCNLCKEFVLDNGQADHATACPWRRAKEYVAARK